MDGNTASPRILARALSALGGAATLALASSPAAAMDTFFVGSRGQAMAGALTAAVDDTDAQYYNPAAFGFFNQDQGESRFGYKAQDNNDIGRKDFGLGVDAGAGTRIQGDMGRYIDILSSADLEGLSNGIDSPSEAEDLMALTSALGGIDDPGNAFVADANTGFATRFGHFGIGVRALLQSSGQVTRVDTSQMGINTADLGTEIDNQVNSGQTINDVQVLTDDQVTTLKSSTDFTKQAIADLDYLAQQEGLTSSDLDSAIQVISDMDSASSSGTTSFSSNNTLLKLKGFGVAEVPVTYGYALNPNWSIGGNLKIMRGRVYGNHVRVFDNDSGDTIAKTTEEYEETTTAGVDLGVMARYGLFNFGLTGRNLNSPTFEGFRDSQGYEYDDVTLDPQVRAGVAFIPHETVTLEVDYDLTANETVLRDYETQLLSGAFEWDAFNFLALRAGAYKNMAEDDIGVVYTAGVGVNLWLLRADLAAAASPETTTVDGNELPREMRASLEVSFDF